MSHISKQDILEFLREEEFIFHDVEIDGEITKDTKLKDIDVDSLDLITANINCEEQFNCKINDVNLSNIITVGDYVTLVYNSCKESE